MAIIAVASALFMQSIDSTALSTALPTLARAFNTNPIHLKLCLTAYIMALAVFVPASAWMADRYGARRVFMGAMMVFLVGSMLCAQSHSLLQLVGARILQGAGGAMMTPVGRIIVVGSQPREQLVRAMIWLTTPAMLGPILGPPLSGFILSIADWPWIFYINIPVGILGVAAVFRFVPRIRQPHPGRFDSAGFALAATAISAAMIGAESMGVALFPLWVEIGAWILAVAAGWGYIAYARKRQRPVLDLRLLKIRTYRSNQTGGSLIRMKPTGRHAVPAHPAAAGRPRLDTAAGRAACTMASALGSMSARVGAQTVLSKYGFKNTLIFTAITCGVAVGDGRLVPRGDADRGDGGTLALGGFLRSNHLTSISTLAFADIPDNQVSQASSFTAVVQQMSQALGITLAGLMLHVAQQINGPHVRPLDPSNFILPFGAIGLCGMLAAATYLPLPKHAGSNLHGREGVKGRR